MINAAAVRDRINSAYNNATAGVSGGPEAAAGLLLAYKVAQLVADEIASILEDRPSDSDTQRIIEGIRCWSRQ